MCKSFQVLMATLKMYLMCQIFVQFYPDRQTLKEYLNLETSRPIFSMMKAGLENGSSDTFRVKTNFFLSLSSLPRSFGIICAAFTFHDGLCHKLDPLKSGSLWKEGGLQGCFFNGLFFFKGHLHDRYKTRLQSKCHQKVRFY